MLWIATLVSNFGGLVQVVGASWLMTSLTGADVVLTVGALIERILPLSEFGHLDLDALDRFRPPTLKLDLPGRSGPIMVTISYTIAQQDVRAFLRVMIDRRKIRLREGAQRWGLLRDLESPENWTGVYHVPTWIEHIRHNQYHTCADQHVWDRLCALRRGDGPPTAHRMIERQTVPLHDDTPITAAPS